MCEAPLPDRNSGLEVKLKGNPVTVTVSVSNSRKKDLVFGSHSGSDPGSVLSR